MQPPPSMWGQQPPAVRRAQLDVFSILHGNLGHYPRPGQNGL